MDIPHKDLLVNTSPIGMHKEDPCLIKPADLHEGLFVYDLVYNPARTKLLALAEGAGIRCSNGLGMLLYQGVISLKYFTGRMPPVEIMRKALEKGAKQP
jgi:shikimate dehydrogenase